MDTSSSALLPTLNDAELQAIFRDDERAIWRYRLLAALFHDGRSVRDVADEHDTTPETLRSLRAAFLESGRLDVLRSKRRGAAGHIKRQTPLAQAVARELAADPTATGATIWRRVTTGLGSADVAVPRRSVYRLVDSLREQTPIGGDSVPSDDLWAPALVPALRTALPLLPYDPPTELGNSDLAVQLLPYETDAERRGQWLHDLLIELLVQMGPNSERTFPPLNAEKPHDPMYRPFDVLVGEAWHGQTREELQATLAVAAATYTRAKRQGLEQLAELLVQKVVRQRLNGPQAEPPPAVPLLGRDRDVQYYGRRLEQDGLAIIWGMPGSGKTAIALTLAHQRQAAGETVVWHVCSGSGEGILHALLHSYGIYHDPELMDAEELLAQLRTHLRYGALLVLEAFDEIVADPATEMLVALLRTMITTRAIQLIITTRYLPPWAEGEGWTPLTGVMDDAARGLWTFFGGSTLDPKAWQAMYHYTLGYPRPLQILSADSTSSLETFLREEVCGALGLRERRAFFLLVLARVPLRLTPKDDVFVELQPDLRSTLRELRLRGLATYDHESESYHLHTLFQTHRATLQTMADDIRPLHHMLAEQAVRDERWFDAIMHWSAEGEIERILDVVQQHLHALIADRCGAALNEQLRILRLQLSSGLWLARVEAAIGEIHLALGAYHKATEALLSAIDMGSVLAEKLPRVDLRRWHYLLAEAYQQLGQWRHALTHVQASIGSERLVAAEVTPEQRMALAILQHRIWVQAGEADQARFWLADVQMQLRTYYHPLPAAMIAYMEGVAAMHGGRFDQAITRLQAAYDLLPPDTHHGVCCNIVARLGLCMSAIGRPDEARTMVEAELLTTQGLGHQSGAATLAFALVEILLDLGCVEGALRALGQAELLVDTANPRAKAELHLAQASVALRRPGATSALDHLLAVIETVSEPPLPELIVRAYLMLARLSARQGALPIAAQHAARAVRLATSAGLLHYRALAHLYLVRDAIERQAWDEARAALSEATLNAHDPVLDHERRVLEEHVASATGEPYEGQAVTQHDAAVPRRLPMSAPQATEPSYRAPHSEPPIAPPS